jgi:hypothetical protein
MDLRTRGRLILLSMLLVVLVTMPDAVAAKPPGTGGLYVPPPQPGAVAQIEDLIESRDADGAELIERMAGVPQAVWIEQGAPEEARDEVKTFVKDAKRHVRCPSSSRRTSRAATARTCRPAARSRPRRTRRGSTASRTGSAVIRRSSSSSPTVWDYCPRTARRCPTTPSPTNSGTRS